ncbi:hypothetical protein KIPB_000118 [Kipferlia bialata]|uniref:Uncharacterized protein n=1 Tax=Kipferlia bialata TaxID=797122 RepID=A0A9K3GEH0_9EUKA|nr:hypothetical protein KIPB_000118 [Kipferlia bialata]|eukprot:g118.t1
MEPPMSVWVTGAVPIEEIEPVHVAKEGTQPGQCKRFHKALTGLVESEPESSEAWRIGVYETQYAVSSLNTWRRSFERSLHPTSICLSGEGEEESIDIQAPAPESESSDPDDTEGTRPVCFVLIPDRLNLLAEQLVANQICSMIEAEREEGVDGDPTTLRYVTFNACEISWLLNLRAKVYDTTPSVPGALVVSIEWGVETGEDTYGLRVSCTLVSNVDAAALFKSDNQESEMVSCVHPYTEDALSEVLSAPGEVKGETLLHVDPAALSVSAARLLETKTPKSERVEYGETPVGRYMVTYTPQEVAAAERAHVKDGVAWLRTLSALETGKETVSEEGVAGILQRERSKVGAHCESFEAIVGFGPNGALVHHRGGSDTLPPSSAVLIDCGGQFEAATTDTTRSFWHGAEDSIPSAYKADWTCVLRAMINTLREPFPIEATGLDLDKRARDTLLGGERERTFGHGTGHTVQPGLAVHGGHLGISVRPCKQTRRALDEHMVVSVEPGCYRETVPRTEGEREGEGESVPGWGIRHEVLAVVDIVTKREGEGEGEGEGEAFQFRVLTMVPFDTRCLVLPTKAQTSKDAITHDELAWLNAYHVSVRAALEPLLQDESDAAALDLLLRQTAPVLV